MITVLNGPVVDSFDQEFRILFAASHPVPNAEVSHQLKNISDFRFNKHLPLELEISNPPSPPLDSHLDWEAMGVIPIDPSIPDRPLGHQETEITQSPVQKAMLFDKAPPLRESLTEDKNQLAELKR